MTQEEALKIIENFEKDGYKTEAGQLLGQYPILREYAILMTSGFDAIRYVQADKVATMQLNLEGLLFMVYMMYHFSIAIRGEL